MCAFIAAIRRLPGGTFVKVPKSHGMTAIPVQTSLTNLSTYFSSWPKKKSQFLLYGTPHRCVSTSVTDSAAALTTTPLPRDSMGAANGETADESSSASFHLYGGGGPVAHDGPNNDAAGAAGAAAKPSRAQTLTGFAEVMRRFRLGNKLTMVTAYDYPSARFARDAGVEFALVGDSMGNCRLGLTETVGIMMEDMLRATTAVRRGLDTPTTVHSGPKPVLVGDMPFGSYLVEADALRNAAAFRMAGADMVKLEGNKNAPLVKALTSAGIGVMGHIGLAPQSALLQGGLRLQGTTAASAMDIVQSAEEIVAAGAVGLLLECVPLEVGRAVQAAVPHIPVIGIGAGGQVAGQVLVCDDLLGLHGSPPSFVKTYSNMAKAVAEAYEAFVAEVRSGDFPGAQYSRRMKTREYEELQKILLEEKGTDITETPCEKPKVRIPMGKPVSEGAPKMAVLTVNGVHGVNGTPMAKATGHSASQIRLPRREFSGAPRDNELAMLHTRKQVDAWRRSAGKVALVPTMGNLHEGHLELIDIAKANADNVLVSIFVNPSQFAAHEDFGTYPRTLQRDTERLAERGVAAVFAPAAAEIYPGGSPGRVVVTPNFVQGKSEADCRPHFFSGVATVCLKLFNICRPDVVVFGQKDAMQCCVIRRMLEDLCLDDRIELVIAPTSRESDGLARSSRNTYLTPAMRARAPAIHAALVGATQIPGGTAGAARAAVRKELESGGMVVEYVSVADLADMNEKDDEEPLPNSVLSIACLLMEGGHKCRLIDNVLVAPA